MKRLLLLSLIASVIVAGSTWYFTLRQPYIAYADTLDQSNTSGSINIGFGQSAVLRYSCQGFKPTLTSVTAISFYMNNTIASQGRLVWIDNADANSFPTGTLAVGLGSTELTNAQILAGNGALTKYTLTSPITVTPGNQYVYCMAPWNTSTHAYADDYSDYLSSVSNPYANGKMSAYDCSGACTWTNNDSGNGDRRFEVYGNVAATINTFTVQNSSMTIQNASITIQAR